jgi:hypothetical protein
MQIKLLSFAICALTTIVSCNLKPHNFQYKDAQDLEKFLISVDLSNNGFHNFVCQRYNNPEYVDFLANDFKDLVEFLEYGIHSHQSRMYTQQVVRLFSNEIKRTSYVNSDAFSIVLQKMPRLLESFFVPPKRADLHVLQENINSLLYNSFLQKFSLFKESPDSFLNELTAQIVQVLNTGEHENDISIEELRKTVIIFLEGSLSKLIWSPLDGVNTWRSVKTIAQQLATLMDCSIITDVDDLNSLYITLVERYCFFIDVASLDLPAPFYEEMKKDILASADHRLFMIEEQDDLIQSKKDRLMTVITAAELQAQEIRIKELSVV